MLCICEDYPCCSCGQEYLATRFYDANDAEYERDEYLDWDSEGDDEWLDEEYEDANV